MADAPFNQALTDEQLLSLYQQQLDPLMGQVDSYINGLMDLAQGDLDYASRLIEEDFQTALGTNDVARKEFLKEVSNKLEGEVGRIVFDYRTGKNRLEEDIARETQQTTESRDLALARLAEDEQIARQGLTRETAQARREQGTALNQRGILAGPRGEAVGLAGEAVGDLEGEINRRFEALERASGRQQADITQGSERQLADISRTGQRGLEDLTTSARRAGLDAQTEQSRALEAQQREFERRKRELEAERKRQEDRATLLARESLERQIA